MKKLVTHFGMKIFVLLVLVGCLAQPNFGQAVGLDSTSDWPNHRVFGLEPRKRYHLLRAFGNP